MTEPPTARPRELAGDSPGMSAGASCGFDDDPSFGEAVEDFSVEEFVAELRVEALAVAVLPRAARLDECGAGADSGDPIPHRLGDELGAMVGADVTRHAAEDEQVRQDVDDVRRP